MTTAEPAQFRDAVAAMNATTVRPEIELGPIRPPQRLAPFSYALGAEVRHPETAIVPERSEGDALYRVRAGECVFDFVVFGFEPDLTSRTGRITEKN